MFEIIELVQSFSRATGVRDLETLEKILHESYSVVAVTEEGVRTIPKVTYIQMMSDKVIGCIERGLEIDKIDVQGEVAFVFVRHIASSKIFEDRITALKTKEGWKMLFNCSVVSTRSA
jgi:hypothetical protein